MKELIRALPKVELHMHIEGALEPELMFALAQKNKVTIAYDNPQALKASYQFKDLQSFLDLYYVGASVLKQEQDFYDLTWAYMQKMHQQNVRHTEIFFDPQTHLLRGINMPTVINGIYNALQSAKKQFNITSGLILCFLRDLPVENAMETLEQALPYKDKLIAVGLDSAEQNHPPKAFARVFKKAREEGLLAVAHAGEEGPPAYIHEALDELKVVRIDHGVRCLEDPSLVQRLKTQNIPLTVCPLSNVKLRVFDNINLLPLRKMLAAGLAVTINSDDPAYFNGYIEENYQAVAAAFSLNQQELLQLAENAIVASFCSAQRKQELLTELKQIPLCRPSC